MRYWILPCLILAVAPAQRAETVSEPRGGVAFERKLGGLTLTGVALRTKTLLKVRVYAVGLYVADS